MPGEVVRELVNKLGLDFDAGAFELADAAMGALKKGLAGVALIASAGAGALAGMVAQTASAAGEIDDLSARTGVAADVLQGFGYAASLGGVSLEELAAGFAFAAKAGVRDLPGYLLGTADQIKALVDKGQGAAAAALAMEKFGRAGARLVPFLKGGRAEIGELVKEAHALGYVMDAELVAAGDAFGDNLDRLKMALAGLRNAIVGPLIGKLANVLDRSVRWLAENRKRIADAVHWVGRLVAQWKLFAVVLGSAVLAALLANIAAVASAVGWYAALGVAAIGAAVKAAAAWVIATLPVVLLAALIAALILIAEDLWVTMKGGEGVMTAIFAKWTKFTDDLFKKREGDDWFTAALKGWMRGILDMQGATDSGMKVIEKRVAAAVDFIVQTFERGRKLMVDGLKTLVRGGFNAGDAVSAFVSGNLFGADAGGASSPAAAAALQTSALPAAAPGAFSLNLGGVTIVQQPGESGDGLANRFRQMLEDFHETKLREARATVGE